MAGKSKIVREAFDAISRAFSEKMNRSGGELFGESISSNSPLPKISDLQSFRNTDQFQQIKENVRPEIESKMSEGIGPKVNLTDDFLDSQVAEIFDVDVYGSFPSSDMWADISPKEISNMVRELKVNKNLPNEDILEYFSLMGGARNAEAADGTPVINLVKESASYKKVKKEPEFDDFDEERQHSGYDRYTPEPHPAEGLYTDEERARWKK